MKYPLALGSILLLAPAVSQAQAAPDEAPTLVLPKAPAQTPALDAFAGMGTQLQLQARWVRIDVAALPANLPAWNRAGTWSHVATPEELKVLELMNRTGTASTTHQQIGATNNRAADLSYSPFTRFLFLQSPPFDSGPIDDMIIPRDKSKFEAAPPYIPNLAKPESRLPAMAPMPGAGDKKDSPFATQNPYLRPQMSPELDEMLTYKFQLRPTIIGSQIALDLRSLNSAENFASLARVNFGETAVFPLPNIVEFLQNQNEGASQYQVKRTLLLVTPKLSATPPLKP